MLFFDGFLGLAAFAVWIFCIIDVITTPSEQVRNLPKLVWVLLVILLVDLGSIAWLIAGRDWNRVPAAVGGRGGGGAVPRPVRRASNPDDDDEFLAGLQARADEQRRRAREADPGDEPGGQK